MRRLWKFYWDCGRMGEVEGLFVASEEQVNSALGKHVYFGEILGKHSDVHGTLEEKDLTVIEVPESAIEAIVAVTGENISGYNPLEFLEE